MRIQILDYQVGTAHLSHGETFRLQYIQGAAFTDSVHHDNRHDAKSNL